MSAPLSRDEVLFRQRLYRAADLYHGKIDGIYGRLTDAAESAWDDTHALIDERLPVPINGESTRRHLHSLHPAAHLQAARCLKALSESGLHARVISGTRTYAEQDAIFRVGRRGVQGERPVTFARGGQSNHNFGIAWDVGLFTPEGKYLQDSPDYERLGSLWKPHAVEWGGDWSPGKVDHPHYQLYTGLSLTAVRVAFETGSPFVPPEASL